MRSKAHWPVFMREQENVDLNAALIRQPLALAILLPLLFSSSTVVILADTMHKGLNAGCISPLIQLWSSTAGLFSCTAGRCFSKTAFHCTSHLWNTSLAASSTPPPPVSPPPAWLFHSGSASEQGSSPEEVFFFVSLESGGTTGSLFIFHHLMCLCSRRQELLPLLLYFCRSLYSPQCTSLYQQVNQL